MTKPPTLNELKQLEESGFGKPYPRHGLKLLYWFAHDCLYFDDDNEMCWQYDPEEGYFGFHLFENRIDEYNDQLLPEAELDYYEVGNLRRAEADGLPGYVREDYIKNHNHRERNMDRIIVSVDDEWFDRVYVTEHCDWTDFIKEATYRISRGLIMIIRELTLEQFLLRTGYWKQQTNIYSTIPVMVPIYLSNQEPPCPTSPGTIPAIMSSTNENICIQIESPPIMTNDNNTTQKHTGMESQLNNFVQDNIIQSLRNSNLQPPSQDNQTTSTIMSSRNQAIDIESPPVSQMNSRVIPDHTQTYLTRIFGVARRGYCTIL